MRRRSGLALALGLWLAACGGESETRGAGEGHEAGGKRLDGAAGGESETRGAGEGHEAGGKRLDGAAGGERFRFTDVAREAGLVHPTWCGRKDKPHLLESGGCGLALLDHDLDGDLDLYVVNGWRLEGSTVVERGRSRLWRNRGNGTFEDVTESSGAGLDVWGCGVAVGDPDGDGDPDLFVTAFGPDVLLENRGDGTFRRVPDPPGMDGWSTGAAFFDADGDGDEDLFVGAYIECTWKDVLEAKPTLDWKGTKVMFGPFGLAGKADRFYRNEGGLRFVEATKGSGLVDVGEYFAFGVSALDLDVDGDLDLYVANDSNPNYLFRNDGKGRFEEMGLWSGAALDAQGASQASMGIACGDVDGDGLVDLFLSHFADDHATLYMNKGRCRFVDATAQSGLSEPTFKPLQWGAVLADLDLDGDLDLAVANGHIYPQADTNPNAGTTFAMRNQVFENEGARFSDVTAEAGAGFQVVLSSRGLAAGDLDGDGDVDLVISNVDAPPTLLRNDSPRRGAWLMVDAPGARRVEVTAGGRTIVRDRVAGESYLSAHDPRFHVGLGPAPRADRVRVVWPGGTETILVDVPAGQVLRVRR